MRAGGRVQRGSVKTSAVSPDLVFQLAEEVKYGSVDAPFGTVAVGAVVVTGIALALTFGFKSGFEAQEKIADRDRGSFNRKPPPAKRPGQK